ncbi:MAG: SOS response-associated peptidase [Candidatus Margulisbacteria bacterium]|nr:SOS response-associated peptidase [Candidatus Margulisiibacteriota bacterium]
MCGRFVQKEDNPNRIKRVIPDLKIGSLVPSYNIAPSQNALVIYQKDGHHHGRYFRWGLVPSWAKDPAIGNRMINARLETVTEKPSFKGPFRRHRCLVPVSGFYEWKKQGEVKMPYYIHFHDELVYFAGLYDTWKTGEGDALHSFTILTQEANAFSKAYHDRMPVIVRDAQLLSWLDGSLVEEKRILALLDTFPNDQMGAYPVSRQVNSPAFNSPLCVERDPGIN